MWFRTFIESREDPDEHIRRTPSSLIALAIVFGLMVGLFFIVKAIFPDFPRSPIRSDFRLLLVCWPLAFYGTLHRKLRGTNTR